jgi:hypothetical protein
MRIPAYLLHTVAYSLALRNESYKKAIMEGPEQRQDNSREPRTVYSIQ